MKLTVEQRLLARTTEDVEVTSPWGDTPCWICNFYAKHGYPRTYVNGKRWRVSRLAYWLWVGELIESLWVNHHCDNTRCINPEHLFLGTAQDGIDDMVRKGGQAKGDRHGSCTHTEKVPRGDTHFSRIHPEKLARGEAHGMAKITEQDVIDIRSYKAQGCRQVDVCRFMKLPQSMVSKVWRGRSWKHIL